MHIKTKHIRTKQFYFKLIAVILVAVFIITFCFHFAYCAIRKAEKKQSDYAEASALSYLIKTDWTAKWIWEKKSKKNTHVMFRRTFILENEPSASITALVAADSKYTMWINGELAVIDGSPKRGPTAYDTYYQRVKLDGLFKRGENTIAVLVWYFGENGYAHNDSGHGGFLFECDFGEKKISSDSDFKVCRSNAFKNDFYRLFAQPNYRLAESNVYYDADCGNMDFIYSDFNDSEWLPANEYGIGGSAPWNRLYLSETPQLAFGNIEQFTNSADYIGYTTRRKMVIEFDIGTAIQFTPYICVQSEEGKKIRIVTDTYRNNWERGVDLTYVTTDGKQEFESPYWISGRKMVVTLPAGITIIDVGFRRSGYYGYVNGSFYSDDDFLNTLWEKSLNSLLINMRDTYMDGPDRERAAWLGDSVIDSASAHFAMGENSYALTKQSFRNLIGWKHNDGVLQTVAPNGIESFELPCQNLAAIYAIYEYYIFSGDIDTLKMLYPVCNDYVKLWEIKDGVLVHRKGSWDWGDWGNNIDMAVLENALYYRALNALEKTADILNDTTTKVWLQSTKAVLYYGFNTKYGTEDGYRSKKYYDDRGNAVAILAGLVPQNKIDGTIKTILANENSSPYMEKCVIEALMQTGNTALAIERLKRRFADMVASDITTLWEGWTTKDGINHGWGSWSLSMFPQYIVGIKSLSAGYEEYEIKPDFTQFRVLKNTFVTVRGEMNICAEVNTDDSITMQVTAPIGGGRIILPANKDLSLSVNGIKIYENGIYIENSMASLLSADAAEIVLAL